MSDNTEPQSEPTPEPTPEAAPAPEPEPQSGTDWKAEARKWEQRAKENKGAADELEAIKAKQRTAQEQAEHAARQAQDRAEALQARLVEAELRAALSGVVDDPAAVVGDLNVSRFVGDDGEVNAEAVTALRERYTGLFQSGHKAPKPNPAQGANGSQPAETPLTRESLKTMTAEQIIDAQNKGLLKDIRA